MEEITGQMILKQLRKNYERAAIITGILLLFAVFGMIVSLIMRGLRDIVTLAAAGIALCCLIFLLVFLYKCAFVQKNRVIQRFGNEEALAACIRAGGTVAIWQTPRSRIHPLIITEEYIVCPARIQTYLPLEEIRSMQRRLKHGVHSAGSKAERDYQKHHTLPDTELYDKLILWDQKKRRYQYNVSVADFHDVVAFLREYQPEMIVKPDRKL